MHVEAGRFVDVFEHLLEENLAQDVVAVHDRVGDVGAVATEGFPLIKINKKRISENCFQTN